MSRTADHDRTTPSGPDRVRPAPAEPVVFISYSHDDQVYAHKLRQALTQRGFEAWIDERLEYGDTWPLVLQERLDACAALLLIMTPHSERSVWVQNELARAYAKDKPIYPLLVHGETWLPVQAIQYVDLRGEKLPPDAFYDQLARDLGPPEPAGRALRDLERAYLDDLLERYRYWRDHYTPLAGAAVPSEAARGSQDRPRLNLPAPFVPREFEALVAHGFALGETRAEVRRERMDDLRQALQEHPRLLLIGDPGSGKTTTLWRLAYDAAEAARQDPEQPLPVLISLGSIGDDEPLEALAARHLGPLAAYLEHYLSTNRLLLLLDGLNEMPEPRPNDTRGRGQQLLTAALRRYSGMRAVVTCRALDDHQGLDGLQRIEIAPLDVARIRAFVRNYVGADAGERLFWELAGPEAAALWRVWQEAGEARETFWTAERLPPEVRQRYTGAQRDLWQRLRVERPPLLALASNPYLLLMMAQVYVGAAGTLPANRAALLSAFVDTLLGRERQQNPDRASELERLVLGLSALAYAIQVERGRGTTVPRAWASEALRRALPGCDPERLLYLAASASLLDAGESTVRFYHQLLQHYLAALKLRPPAAEGLAQFWPGGQWWHASAWDETMVMLAGLEDEPVALLSQLCDANPLVAARCVMESGTRVKAAGRAQVTRALMAAMTDAGLPPIARALAGNALACLGDPRPGVSVDGGLPDVALCAVPAGPFTMGSADGDPTALAWERPQHRLCLPAYRISRYPITNAQYAAFETAGGYGERRYWSAAGWAWLQTRAAAPPRYRQYPVANHPVCSVTWYEARAFCAWLTEQWRAAERISPGEVVRLPTEAEWEKAARGGDGRLWPWGSKPDGGGGNQSAYSGQVLRAVHGQGYPELGLACSVGMFPGAASPYGCHEMAGQVWEWTCSRWGGEADWAHPRFAYPYDPGDGREDPQDPQDTLWVLRGGAFDSEPWDTRSTRRNRDLPDLSVPKIGFRVVVAGSK